MKMILAIVQLDDVHPLLDELMANGLRATKISSTGGFLRTGNCTVVIGVEDDQVAGVVSIIRSACHTRRVSTTALPFPVTVTQGAFSMAPVEVEVGGAHIFIWKVRQAGHY